MIVWMGRYRQLVEALVRHVNQVNRAGSIKFNICDDLWVNSFEWQVLEYLYEHESNDDPMLRVSETLGIAQSTYSKIINHLHKGKLIEKFHTPDNKKNVIIRISEKGKKAYECASVQVSQSSWHLFFERLNELSDESLSAFTEALDLLTSGLPSKQEDMKADGNKLIPID